MTIGFLRAQQPELSDATAIVASLEAPAAFSTVFERHHAAVHRYLARRLGVDMADELAAEVFAVAFAKRGRYDASFEDARAWLFGIATRLAQRHWRREERELRAYARTGLDPVVPSHDEHVAAQADSVAAGPALAAACADPWRVQMDELDLIRSFRAGTAPPSELATARARRAWLQPEPRRPRWGLRVAVAACLAAAATAVALVVPAGDGGRLAAPEASAAQTLRLAAKAHHGGLARPLRPGEFFYSRTKSVWNGEPADRESWIAIDGTRRWLDERQLGRDFRVGPKARPFRLGDEAMSYTDLLALPREAEPLHQRLRQAAVDCGCGHSVDHETFVIVGDLMRENPIPADLEAALLRAAALIPGIRLIEREHDAAGRAGVGVAVDYKGYRSVLVFDRDSYELLGEIERHRGRLIGGTALLESGVVGSITALP